MSYLVCVSTAGTGSRLGKLTSTVNKSLVTVAGKPVISRIIDQFPDDARFVVALGFGGELVREFLEHAYPERCFSFVTVDRFEGPGTGLGYSLLCCRPELREPFVFCSCDTLTSGAVPAPAQSWMAYAEVAAPASYRTLALQGSRVIAVNEKGAGDSSLAYIGLAGIGDPAKFWEAMAAGGATAIDQGESWGLKALVEGGEVAGLTMQWFDTGNSDSLAATRKAYEQPDAPNILDKPDEAIWFIGDRVVKYSADSEFIKRRVERATRLEGYVPPIAAVSTHFYSYPRAEGQVMSKAPTLPLLDLLLEHGRQFWRRETLDAEAGSRFRAACMKFYRDKTYERVALFYSRFGAADSQTPINDVAMPALATLLGRVDWESLSDGLPGRFHGDFHFENILYDEATGRFTFLDWRQDFAGNRDIGDIYYDFAKLKHGFIICHELITLDRFSVAEAPGRVAYDFERKQSLVGCELHFDEWLQRSGFSVAKVRLLTALIFLNIAALHHDPYCRLLFNLGKAMLAGSESAEFGIATSRHGHE